MWINILCGILTSTLFYYLLVYIPDQIKEYKAFKKSFPHLQFIALRMELFIAYTAKVNNISVNKDDKYYLNIHFQKSMMIDIDEPEKKYVYYKRLKDGTLQKTKGFAYDISDLKIHNNMILDRLNRVLSIPNIEYDLFNILISLRDCYLLTALSDHELLNKEKDQKFHSESRVSFLTGIYEYHNLYKKLLKYVDPPTCYVLK